MGYNQRQAERRFLYERLPDGRLILACNSIENPDTRAVTPLSMLVSEDDGKTFSLYSNLCTMQGRYFYPALQYKDGKLHVTFTWNRKNIVYMCFDEL